MAVCCDGAWTATPERVSVLSGSFTSGKHDSKYYPVSLVKENDVPPVPVPKAEQLPSLGLAAKAIFVEAKES